MEWVSMAVGFILGLISSFTTSIIWERYDRNFAQPIRELQGIKRRIISALDMHARWLSNPAFVPTDGTPINAPDHELASYELRTLSTELSGLISILPICPLPGKGLRNRLSMCWRSFKYYHSTKDMPSLEDLTKVSQKLMGISNNLFLPAGVREDGREHAQYNMKIVESIKKLLRFNQTS